MKRLLLILLCSLSVFLLPNKKVDEESKMAVSDIPIVCSSYVVMERSTNKVLEGKNLYEMRSVASISKIMTAIVAIENVNLNDIVTIPKEINQVYGSMLYIHENDQIPIMDLLYGLMLRSGNDAAVSIAIHVSGSIDKFVELMNQKAQVLKMENSLFKNPHGLDEEDGGNLSCAYDMAILHAYALNNPIYQQITSCKKYKTYQNKNRLFNMYEYTSGGKTGFTKIAKRTLVTSAKKDDLELVIVTLNCGNDFGIHKQLYQAYFQQYLGIIIFKKGENKIEQFCVYLEKEYVMIVPIQQEKDLFLKYEIKKESKWVTVYLQDKYGYVLEEITIELYQLPNKH